MTNWNNEAECLEAVKRYGWALEFVKNQTDEICLAAVKQDGWALKYVKNQTDEICLAAVKQGGWALRCVSNQTDEIIMASMPWDIIYHEDDSIQIGCQRHTKEEWNSFTDDEIHEMDENVALLWWKHHKANVLNEVYK